MTEKNNKEKFLYSLSRGVVSHLITVLLTLGGVWLLQNRQSQIFYGSLSVTPDPINLERYNKEKPVNYNPNSIEEGQKIAIEQFKKNDIVAGKKAVESLLARGSFFEAKEALSFVQKEAKDDPDISFLKGRLAWELLHNGERNYTIDEALFFWEKAVKENPNSIPYQNALGFAYYSKGDLKKAYDSWFKVLQLSGEISSNIQKVQQISTNNDNTESKSPVTEKETLNAYAGIGLVMMKSAQAAPENEERERWLRALQYRTKVMKEAAMEYHIPQLRQNWLWSRVALRDWDFLMRVDWNILGKKNN
ncbi:MAG: hypothetical protein WBA93_15955 [Microcoleaceae cyanobacterium]